MAAISSMQVEVPALYLAGKRNTGLFYARPAKNHRGNASPVLRLTRSETVAGAGHWLAQEQPAVVNALLVKFLDGLCDSLPT